MLRQLLAAVSLLAACAPCVGAQDYSPSPDQLSLVDRTCARVMGLRPGETWFAACQESLSQALPAADRRVTIAIADDSGLEAGKSFYEVNPSVRWNRERYACAQIGLRSDSTSFHQCAAGLDGAFLPSLN